MKRLLLILLCLFLTRNANAICRTVYPTAIVDARPGNVRYVTNLSRDEFLKRAPQKMSPNTLGMTVSKLGINGMAEPEVQQDGRQVCVSIKKMTLIMGYDTLDVYIDKKYKPGSCEYEVVKEHENYHVRVSQEAMKFFKQDIEKSLKKALNKVKPIRAKNQAEAQKAFEKQFNQVMKEMQPLIDHINKKIAEKNYLIDTPESYAETTALCPNW